MKYILIITFVFFAIFAISQPTITVKYYNEFDTSDGIVIYGFDSLNNDGQPYYSYDLTKTIYYIQAPTQPNYACYNNDCLNHGWQILVENDTNYITHITLDNFDQLNTYLYLIIKHTFPTNKTDYYDVPVLLSSLTFPQDSTFTQPTIDDYIYTYKQPIPYRHNIALYTRYYQHHSSSTSQYSVFIKPYWKGLLTPNYIHMWENAYGLCSIYSLIMLSRHSVLIEPCGLFYNRENL